MSNSTKTQSVCGERFNKHVNMVCNLEKGHSHMHHFEPVSEPAFTGEPHGCLTCHHPVGYHHDADDACTVLNCKCKSYLAARGPSASQTSADKKQCGCVHGDSDPYCPDPLCPNYIAASPKVEEWCANLEKKYGCCCGDMLNISAADLADELRHYFPPASTGKKE